MAANCGPPNWMDHRLVFYVVTEANRTPLEEDSEGQTNAIFKKNELQEENGIIFYSGTDDKSGNTTVPASEVTDGVVATRIPRGHDIVSKLVEDPTGSRAAQSKDENASWQQPQTGPSNPCRTVATSLCSPVDLGPCWYVFGDKNNSVDYMYMTTLSFRDSRRGMEPDKPKFQPIVPKSPPEHQTLNLKIADWNSDADSDSSVSFLFIIYHGIVIFNGD
ncbi:unnamed protein product [Protopolystoma xenopodis]|uniref:Uncharacterized protein n=1 Tax=Protopolystoma xenopodis TaxID=117903 RepID=A0A448WJ94_9PLAT|nr:unnamed protein product [Protopolystoma xenopodis]